MRLRAAHLALLMLLLSSLGAAEASALRSGRGGLGNHAITAMLQQNVPALHAETPLAQATAGAAISGSPTPRRTAWLMRPPAAHSAHQHAVTASLV